MDHQKTLSKLLIAAILLPVFALLLLGVGRLLTALQDAGGAILMDRLALLVALGWCLSLFAIVVLLAMRSLVEQEDSATDQELDEEFD